MKLRSAITVQIVLCLLSLGLEAQQFHFQVFTPENGLPASGVYAVDQDERGYIWVATSEGLARYDGAEFIKFDVSTGLPRDTRRVCNTPRHLDPDGRAGRAAVRLAR